MGRPIESAGADRRRITQTVLIWLAIWLILGGFLSYVIMPLGIDYFNGRYLTALYFLLSAGAGLFYYKVDRLLDHHAPFRTQLLLMVFMTTLILACGYLVNLYFPLNAEQTARIHASKLVFPLFTFGTWIAKLADVGFQQVYIFALLKELRAGGLGKKQCIRLFGAVFGVLHLPLLLLLGFKGVYFIVPSLFAGVIFSYLILYSRRGLFYSFAVHLMFYFTLGVVLRYLAGTALL